MSERRIAPILTRASAAVVGITALAGCGGNETQALDLPDALITQPYVESESVSSSFVAEWDTASPEAARMLIHCGTGGLALMDLRTAGADGPFDQLVIDDKNLTAELPGICNDGTVAGAEEAADALRVALDEKRLYNETK